MCTILAISIIIITLLVLLVHYWYYISNAMSKFVLHIIFTCTLEEEGGEGGGNKVIHVLVAQPYITSVQHW